MCMCVRETQVNTQHLENLWFISESEWTAETQRLIERDEIITGAVDLCLISHMQI